jgi:hypothetical protein
MAIPPMTRMLAIGDGPAWLVFTAGSSVGDVENAGVVVSVRGECSGVGVVLEVAVGDTSVALRTGVLWCAVGVGVAPTETVRSRQTSNDLISSNSKGS